MKTLLKSVLAASAMLALGAIAAKAETTLSVTATPVIFKPMFEALVSGFEAKHPDIKIELTVPPGEQEAAVQDILRRATINDLPDVTFQGYNYLRTLVERGIPVALNDRVSGEPQWDQNYSPSVTKSGTVGGKVVGLGVGISFPVFYYNAAVVENALGKGVAFPETWEGIVRLAKQVQARNPDLIGAFYRSHPWIFQAHIESLGGRLMNPQETEITFDGPEGRQVFDTLKAFGEAGQARAQMTREQGRQAFVAGALGIFMDSSSLLKQHSEQIGGRFPLAVAAFPIDKARGSIPAAGIASVMLTRDAAKQAAAWTFMKWVSGSEGQPIVAKNTAYIPANVKAMEASSELQAFYDGRPLMKPALDTAVYASAWFAFPENASKADKAIEDAMADVLTLRKEPGPALEALKATIKGLIATH